MNTRRDPGVVINAFLDEGLDELPERSYDAVRAAVDQTRQWAVVGPWKEPQIMTATRFALLAAAIAVVAVVAIRFLPSTNIGPAATPTPTIAPTPSPTPMPVPSGSAALTAGRYVFNDPSFTVTPVSFTLPAGWSATEGTFVVKGGGQPASVSTSTVLFATWKIDHVYGDECSWSGTLKATSTAAEVVDALESQTRAHASLGSSVAPAKPATIDGLNGQVVELSLPDSFSAPGCSTFLRLWPDPGPDESGGWRQVKGQTDKVYAFDVNGTPMLIVATVLSTANPSDVAELQSIVDSVQI